jgi:hypothetical protein
MAQVAEQIRLLRARRARLLRQGQPVRSPPHARPLRVLQHGQAVARMHGSGALRKASA